MRYTVGGLGVDVACACACKVLKKHRGDSRMSMDFMLCEAQLMHYIYSSKRGRWVFKAQGQRIDN